MYLDYSKIKSGQMKQPILQLRTLAGKKLGAIPWVHNLNFEINYADTSVISFDVPFCSNGMLNPVYSLLTSYKVIYTDNLGIYVLASSEKSGNGVSEIKTVYGYSLEKVFEKKNLFLEEGTYNFWNPVDSKDTILGRVIELDPSWSVGYVASRLIGCYRTFDQYDSDALSFCYGDAMEKYCCAFVFDVYKKTINVYDATEDAESLPIYLSYSNLVKSVDVEELTDNIATKVHLSGSDGLTICDVNPMGTDYIVNLDYFLYNGDLDIKLGDSSLTLADRVREWQASIAARQTYYTGLVSVRASLTAQKLSTEADLTTMKGELDTLTAQQSVIIQAMAMETTDAGKSTQQSKLDAINTQISAKSAEISLQEEKISSIESNIAAYMNTLDSINNELSYEGYFSDEEREVLNQYMIEASVSEETFVATDVDTSVSGEVSTVSGSVSVTNAELTRVDLTDLYKSIYVITGGTLMIPDAGITATIMRGTLEIDTSMFFGTCNNYVMTAYLGKTDYNDHSFPTGLITISGMLSQLTNNITSQSQDGIVDYKGTQFSFQTTDASTYFTVSVSDYQKYSVAMELYDFGKEVLDDYAWPVFEFSVDSANFLYHEKFEPFKNKLELGKAVHLDLGSEGLINAKIIGVKLNFEDISSFDLVFSNRYRLKNGAESLADTIQKAGSTTRSFDANKYLYNQVANKTTQVSQFMNGQLNAAVNTILGASNQSVVINGAGIQVGGDSKYQMRIVDNMIAMTDDSWKTAKLALGLFATEETGTQWGVNAEMLAGKLIIGNNMILENATDDGVMQFKVDATGAWLNNATFVLQKDAGGRIILDSKYGIMAGTKLLFDTEGTTVKPSFVDENDALILDGDGMPKNANFFLDIRNGDAYFRGKVKATSGAIGGWTLQDNYLYGGNGQTFVALNGSEDKYSTYAIWAGAENPDIAPFWVQKDGSVYMESGKFQGTVQASAFLDSQGNSMMTNGQWDAEYLNLKGLNINNNFIVDENGKVTINNGSISWGSITGTDDLCKNIEDAQDAADSAADSVKKLANGTYASGTFINGTTVASPNISGGTIIGGRYWDANKTASMLLNDENSSTANLMYGYGSVSSITNSVFGIAGDYIDDNAALYLAGNNLFSASPDVSRFFVNTPMYMSSPLIMSSTYGYGTTRPLSGTTGQVFFQI